MSAILEGPILEGHTATLRTLVALLNERREIDIPRYFTEDFRLDQPGGVCRYGHAGAREMCEGLLALGADVHVAVLDVVESGDRMAVRYLVTTQGPPPLAGAMLAFYRFVGGRIAEDWGLALPQPWQFAPSSEAVP